MTFFSPPQLSDLSKKVLCDKELLGCGWEGTLGECSLEWYSSSPESWMALSGREGYKYKCPKCGNTLETEWHKLS
jgi:hypothetical protein